MISVSLGFFLLIATFCAALIGSKLGSNWAIRAQAEKLNVIQQAYLDNLKEIREDYVGRIEKINGEINDRLSYKAAQMKKLYTDAFSEGQKSAVAGDRPEE